MSGEQNCLITKINDENIDNEIMRRSLSSITKELKRFQFSYDSRPENDLFEVIKKFKASLKSKNNKIEKLNESIKTACIVAKTIISAKDKESERMRILLADMENNSARIIQDNIKFQNIINELTKENLKLSKKIQNLHNWIDLGYETLQNIQSKPFKDLNSFSKFKMIIFYCGQYYADYHNENQRCKQLEQKTRFCCQKINMLEHYLRNLSKDLDNLRCKHMKLHRQEDTAKDTIINIPAVCSTDPIENLPSAKLQLLQFDLSSHLSLVKKMLTDQDALIQSLSQLSNEFNLVKL
ncbi:structural maintenance of chromosomes protein 2-like [Battus philenor]|uniref:structural maintenance of chromosomes protein 2-like n=1 Tax=Battus philenor TaxID=42288 RepID=UPI0035CEB341